MKLDETEDAEMLDFNQIVRLREEQYKFAEMLRSSNFSPDLFRDTSEGTEAEKYKAIHTFYRLKPL